MYQSSKEKLKFVDRISEDPVRSKDQEGIAELVQQSRLIFQGTVEKLSSATISDINITDSMAVVRGEDVFTHLIC